jgi:tRNA modification GTPase
MDTITAISTPAGTGGISVMRISGENAFSIISGIFSKSRRNDKYFDANQVPTHTIHFGYIFDDNSIVDEVLISIFKNPNSYTGENSIEISSHGGRLIAEKIINCILKKGARYAQPGEFTQRAFLNGRIDLVQAEAVAELINSETDMAHSASINQLEGKLSEYLSKIRQDIINVTSLIELELDFAEEDVEFVKKNELISLINNIIDDLNRILETYISGKIIRNGVQLVITGKPNCGKSSLFNSLLQSQRAIVSVIPGTTRDFIQENLIINGILFNLIDTAGLRITEDEIESEGINRTYGKIKDADLILYLIDSSQNQEALKKDILSYENFIEKDKTLKIFSKSDLLKNPENFEGSKISIYDTGSIENLKKEMSSKFKFAEDRLESNKTILTNLRHKICLEKVIESLKIALQSLEMKYSGEFISVDLRNALNSLGEITGEVTNDDILNNIFSRFCIGK